ncbi:MULTISPECIES: alpha/beta hydrolase [unclassified Arthrobacter]|uniref:alpha/beta hydrolase family protein n=1 Tax=unclassified Arthrobacter TaxID=235627 RepID=UPI001E6428C9|nr:MULTISPECIES: alpha/beta hydrolase [unclassified Arthrobacter]MCC9144214.1 alpha/beta hydrolase [Arthrobacter sp. zg-Y919]MDK1275439.1 alpha/beta hydrolase [Arthrobacter sp. zg.Y919]WIB03180.1 alpha/beta hydrolase [Arthrobacter sp. zg-Y919]
MAASAVRIPYGPHPDQYAELTLPEGGAAPLALVVIIHGGYWRSAYDAELGRPLAVDLAARGFAAWNLEYRRAGNGGGWPRTFEDVCAGIDALAPAAREYDVDLSPVVLLGHSAGGHLAVLAAGRTGSPVTLAGVVSSSGVLNLGEAHELGLSDGAVRNFLGCPPESNPQRYRDADPMHSLPLPVPVWALHGEEDTTVPLSSSSSWVDAARASGSPAQLRMIPGDHFAMITPGTKAWDAVVQVVCEAAGIPVL